MSRFPRLRLDPLPKIDLRHLFVLSDDTAILQHATRATPDLHHGYCTDDTARSLIAAMKIFALPEKLWAGPGSDGPIAQYLLVASQRYLAFLAYAFNPDKGRFRNFMQYDRSWLEDVGSEDSHARTLWGLGKAYRFAPNDDVRELADGLMQKAIPAVADFTYIRPCAYALLGLDEYLRAREDVELVRRLHREVADRLFRIHQEHASEEWPWWEDELTWGNAKLPHAMLVGGLTLDRPEMVEAALNSLRWLLEIQTGQDGRLSIIGNLGWYRRGEKKARFAQQPIEAKALVQACLAAAVVSGEARWADDACRCFEWFTGRNDLGLPLYNEETGGCCDGLEANGVNNNQGAESTLAYLISVLELHHYDRACRGETALASAPIPDGG